MSLELELEREQEQREAGHAIAQDQYLEGLTDAAFGYQAQYADNAYLEGYCRGLKELPQVNGRISYKPIPNLYADPKSYSRNVLSADDEF